jgi:hypothetical protein
MAICLLIISIKLVHEGLNAFTAAFIFMLETLRRLVIGDRIQSCHHILLNINECTKLATCNSEFQHGKGEKVRYYLLLVLGTVPHPQKLVTFLMFQCGYFQVHTKFSVGMLFQSEVMDGALKYSGQKTYIRKHSTIPSCQILLEWEGHTSLHHQQPVMNLYLWCIFILQFHYFLVTLFRLPSL